MSAPAPQRNVPLKDIYSDPLDRFWHLYLLDAEKQDAKLTERWKGDADGILIFVCAHLEMHHHHHLLVNLDRPVCDYGWIIHHCRFPKPTARICRPKRRFAPAHYAAARSDISTARISWSKPLPSQRRLTGTLHCFIYRHPG
jgi:hypothetical protein